MTLPPTALTTYQAHVLYELAKINATLRRGFYMLTAGLVVVAAAVGWG